MMLSTHIFYFLVNVLDITTQFEFQKWVETVMHVKFNLGVFVISKEQLKKNWLFVIE
jgi:hypothetical protein